MNLKAALAGTTLVVAGITCAAPAQADEMQYLQLLNQYGHTINDAAGAIAMGYQICDELNYFNGVDVAEWIYNSTPWSQTSTRQEASELMWAAVAGLCPWHDHSDDAPVEAAPPALQRLI